MKIWVDLSNSPHPLLFAPIARRLRAEGHSVVLTSRANAQTVELARERWPDVEVIGGESPRSKFGKIQMIGERVLRLRRWALEARPDVALSHNSYAQIAAARSLGLPVVTTMDFEHQPANHLAFRLADTVILPDALPMEIVHRQGARPRKVVRYPGLKEELYVGDFQPDAEILSHLGLADRPETVVVVVRTPPSRAVYHPAVNPLFEQTLRTVCSQPHVICVALTRHPEQIAAIERLSLPNCIVPRASVDSRSLIYAADVMIGAGGTMTREAALMGIPTWTLFAGTTPAVDLWLEKQGRLARLADVKQLANLRPRGADPQDLEELRSRGAVIEQTLIDATLSAPSMRARRTRVFT